MVTKNQEIIMRNAPTLSIKNASLTLAGTVLFDHLDLTLLSGKLTCLLGPSGVGKTTLLRMMAGLIKSNKNQIIHAHIECDNQQMAYLAQQDSLLPWLTAYDNALLGERLRGNISLSSHHRASELFHQVGLNGSEKKYPRQLSGGMRQRVALIRTLLEDKPIVLMDEPFSAVDAITRFELQSLASTLLKNRTVLLVTHDPFEALRMADSIYILQGKPATLQHVCQLTSDTPRNVDDPLLLKEHAHLFHLLTQAKAMTV